jgi:hypothetical protein
VRVTPPRKTLSILNSVCCSGDDNRYVQHGRHVNDGFPRLRELAITGAEVAWPSSTSSWSTGLSVTTTPCSNKLHGRRADSWPRDLDVCPLR